MGHHFDSGVSLFLAGIIAGFAILGLIILVPGLIAGASTLLLVGIFIGVIAVVLFALAIILKGLKRLLHCIRA